MLQTANPLPSGDNVVMIDGEPHLVGTRKTRILFASLAVSTHWLFVANGDTTAHYQKVLHFIRVCNVCKGKNGLQTKEYNIFLKIITITLDMYNGLSQFIVSNQL